jgi:hypothetical protein
LFQLILKTIASINSQDEEEEEEEKDLRVE